MLRSENRDVDESRALSAIDALSTRLAELSEHLLAIAQDETNKMTLSMVTILKCFSKRWHVAGQCDPRRNFTH